jgi:hypothetical protein
MPFDESTIQKQVITYCWYDIYIQYVCGTEKTKKYVIKPRNELYEGKLNKTRSTGGKFDIPRVPSKGGFPPLNGFPPILFATI